MNFVIKESRGVLVLESDPRQYSFEDPFGGYVDEDGVEWFACDPYPTWYRWVKGKLIRR